MRRIGVDRPAIGDEAALPERAVFVYLAWQVVIPRLLGERQTLPVDGDG